MGRVARGIICSVFGCEKQAVRSLSTEKVSFMRLKVEKVKRAYLCKDHYKTFRRNPVTKKENKLNKWRYRS